MRATPTRRGYRYLGVGLSVLAVTLAAGCGSASGDKASSDAATPVPAYTPVYAPQPTFHTANGLAPGVLSEIRVGEGSAPVAPVAGDGSIWVNSHRSTDVYRIDPKTDKLVATIDVGHESCLRPVIVGQQVWVASCDDGVKTTVIDSTTNQVVGGAALASPSTFIKGAVWGPTYGLKKLAKVNPTTFKVEATVNVPTGDVAYDGHYLWSAKMDDNGDYLGTLTAVDPVTDKIVKVLHTRRLPDGSYITYAYGSLWLKGVGPTMLRVNPKTDATKSFTIPHAHAFSQFGDGRVEFGFGSLWIRTSDDTFARIDPKTVTVTHVYRGDENGDGGLPLVAFGSLWTANFSSDTVWRFRITP